MADATADQYLASSHAIELVRRLVVATHTVRAVVEEAVAQRGHSAAEFLVLWCCGDDARDTMDQRSLAAATGASTTAISGTVEKLRAQGLLTCCRPDHDRRRQVWKLTELGRRTLTGMLADLGPSLADWLGRLTTDDQSALSQQLAQFAGQRAMSLARPKLRAIGLLLLAVATICLHGCTRAFYRTQADDEVYCIVEHVGADPRWPLDHFSIQPDPRSRMYDPDCPDYPPMPPDDPASHKLMHCVDGKPGYPGWHRNGDTDQVENRDYLAHLPRDAEGNVVFDMGTALQTAFINSPQYQNELEDVYLSALDVTFERFRFDVQFFGGGSAIFTADGRLRNGDGQSSSELELATSPAGRDLQMRRLFSTGGELVVGLANSIVYQFSGPDSHTYNTLLDFSLVQPLLRAGGRDRVLERLTIAERALLANVRQMERYRQGFVTSVITGRDAGPGPSRRGGFFGGSGLEGFSGVGGGGFGRVGAAGGGQNQGDFGTAGGAGAARAGGYLGLLQDAQEIRNLEANVVALRDSLERLRVSSASPNLDTTQAIRLRLQLELARQALHTGESRLILARNDYKASLDRFKFTLGLAPDVNLRIDDPLLDRFQLIDNQLTGMQAAADRVLLQLQPPPEQAANFRQNLALYVAELKRYEAALAAAVPMHAETVQRLGDVEQTFQQLERAVPERRRLLDQLSRRKEVVEQNVAPEVLNVQVFDQSLAQLKRQLLTLQTGIADPDAEPTKLREEISAERMTREAELQRLARDDAGNVNELFARRQGTFDRVNRHVRQLSDHLADMWLLKAKARLESLSLVPIELDSAQALQIASANRLDWMNARAALVDAWRLVQFNADSLESDLDLIFSGDMGTVGKNPVKFDAATGRLRVGVQFDAPLTRLAERNTYRQSLIEYQQARRNYYRYVDGVNISLRNTLRTIELNQLNFELRRVAVHTALTQVDLAREQLLAPVRPDQPAQTGDIGRDLVSALADLVQVQNDLLSVWLNYRVQQMALDLDLGTMRLDERGMWVERTDFERLATTVGGDCCGSPTPLGERGPFDPAPPPTEEPSLEQVPAQPAEPTRPAIETLPPPPTTIQQTSHTTPRAQPAEFSKAARSPWQARPRPARRQNLEGAAP